MSELYEKSLYKLELDQVLALLSECAGSSEGKGGFLDDGRLGSHCGRLGRHCGDLGGGGGSRGSALGTVDRDHNRNGQ